MLNYGSDVAYMRLQKNVASFVGVEKVRKNEELITPPERAGPDDVNPQGMNRTKHLASDPPQRRME